MSDALNDVSKQFNEKFSQISVRAVLINLGLYAALSLGIILLFSALRPKIRTVYQPKSKYSPDDKKPPPISSSFFAWLSPIFGTKEDEMIDKLGLDAVAYLRFLRMLRYMFLAIATLVCAVLLPCDLIYNFKNVKSDARDPLSMLTIQKVKGNLLFVHVAISYLIHGIAYWFIWTNSKRMVDLRWRYFRSKDYQNSLASRSIMITQVSKKNQSDERLANLVASLNIPYPTTAVHIARKVGEMPDLIDTHSQKVKDFEQCLTTYIKRGAHPDKRPKITKGGCLGVGGEKYDAINEYKNVLGRLEQRIWTARSQIDMKKPQSYGFASFARVPYAHMVAHKLKGKSVQGSRIQLAPVPKDIIWDNLLKNDHSRRSATVFGTLLLGAIMLLYTAPLAAVSAISNLASLTAYVSFLNEWSNSSPNSFAIVSGIAPPILAVLLQLILPMIIRAICKWQGALTHTQLDRRVFARYFFFLVITQFIAIALLGMIFSVVADIVNQNGKGSFVLSEVQQLPEKIQNTYVQQSSYFLTWFPLRGFSAIFEIAQLISLFLNAFRTKLFGKTRRQKEEWSAPPPMDYAVYGANTALMVMVAMVYAPLAPIVAVMATAAFFASSWVTKYMLLYVFVTKVESGGRMWRQYVNRLLVAILFMQLLMCLTIALQTDYIKTAAAAPPVFILLVFKWFLNHRFGQKFRWYLPENEEVVTLPIFGSDDAFNAKTSEVTKAAAKLAKRFGHPSLHQQLLRPYVYKSQEAALGEILGDVEVKNANSKRGTENIVAGGIKFTAFDDNMDDLTQEEYLKRQRQEDDWETGSTMSSEVASSAGGAVAHEKDYFNARQRAQGGFPHGPSSLSGTPLETPYDMGPGLGPRPSVESSDNLLAHAAPVAFGQNNGRARMGAYAPVNNESAEDLQYDYYDDLLTARPPQGPQSRPQYHSRNGSNASLQSLQSQGAIAMNPQPYPGHAYPPGAAPPRASPPPSYRTGAHPANSRLPPGAGNTNTYSSSASSRYQQPYDDGNQPSQNSQNYYY